MESYPRTLYASMGALTLARYYFERNDLKAAQAQLEWVADKAPSGEFRDIARLRLAAIVGGKARRGYAVALAGDGLAIPLVATLGASPALATLIGLFPFVGGVLQAFVPAILRRFSGHGRADAAACASDQENARWGE